MADDISVRKINIDDLRIDILPPATKAAFLKAIELPVFSTLDLYLAGGTALALQVGHRESVDLDFFTPREKFDEVALERELITTGSWQTDFRQAGTVYGRFNNAKMSVIAYPFFVHKKPFLRCGSINILSVDDIAVMKIIAISQRGRKRDFIDMYWYCKNGGSLTEIISRVGKQYPGQDHNLQHFIKSIAYFEDAEEDPMPVLNFSVKWEDVKKFFRTEAKKIAEELLLK